MQSSRAHMQAGLEGRVTQGMVTPGQRHPRSGSPQVRVTQVRLIPRPPYPRVTTTLEGPLPKTCAFPVLSPGSPVVLPVRREAWEGRATCGRSPCPRPPRPPTCFGEGPGLGDLGPRCPSPSWLLWGLSWAHGRSDTGSTVDQGARPPRVGSGGHAGLQAQHPASARPRCAVTFLSLGSLACNTREGIRSC